MMREQHSEPRAARSLWAEGALFLGLLAVVRIAMLWALFRVTGGQEFTDDVLTLYVPMLEDPFSILRGDAVGFGQFPPLLPLLLLPVAWPLRELLPDFLAVRSALVAFELLAWPLVWFILCRSFDRPRSRRLLAAAWIACPMTWVTSVVMCQDEAMGLLFSAAIVASLLTERRHLAIVVASLAVCAVKIFFLVPLAALVLVPSGRASWRGFLTRGVLAGAPIAAVYGWANLAALSAGRPMPLADFNPPIMFCVSLWTALSTFEEIPRELMATASAGLSLLTVAGVVLLARADRFQLAGADLVRLASTLLLFVFVCFYHVNPEYFAMAVPMLLILFSPLRGAGVLLAGLSLPWAVNLLYGVAGAVPGASPGKQVFVDAYRALTSMDPQVAHQLFLWVTVIFVAGMAIASTAQLAHRTALPRPRLAPARLRPLRVRHGHASAVVPISS